MLDIFESFSDSSGRYYLDAGEKSNERLYIINPINHINPGSDN
ncbi:MAG: hypothetical protein QM764_15960 [Chitinophagaceae bacterium]